MVVPKGQAGPLAGTGVAGNDVQVHLGGLADEESEVELVGLEQA
jgi:hypothetical protein